LRVAYSIPKVHELHTKNWHLGGCRSSKFKPAPALRTPILLRKLMGCVALGVFGVRPQARRRHPLALGGGAGPPEFRSAHACETCTAMGRLDSFYSCIRASTGWNRSKQNQLRLTVTRTFKNKEVRFGVCHDKAKCTLVFSARCLFGRLARATAINLISQNF
jgi:hypothetical protein